MKFVLFSDLHLDTEFAWLGRPEAARRRRESLRRTLLRILELARSEDADAVLCAGDLYEHERFTPDTAEFLRGAFASLHPMRVFLAPGNHDWYGPQSLYRRVAWSDNVHVFDSERLRPMPLAAGITLWGAAHRAPSGTEGFLDGFRVDQVGSALSDGIHLALFHGSDNAGLREQEDGKRPHAPFDAADIPRAGLHHAFVGHYHTPRDAAHHTYPGNPEPLAFGETGERGAVIVRVGPDGSIERERRSVASTILNECLVDVGGCRTRQEVRERVAMAVTGLRGVARITLEGELGRDVDLVTGDLAVMTRELEGPDGPAPDLDALALRFGTLRAGYDLDAISREPNVRGQFVRDVLGSDLPAEPRRRVLMTGLRALDGRDDLEVP